MEGRARNLEAACAWMDEAFGEKEGRDKRQKDQFWRARLNSEFLKAVKKGDLELVNKWLNYGASVHSKCQKTGDGAALIAASLEDDAILRRLLELGASPSAKNLKGLEPIHVAVWHGKAAAVKVLCEKDPSVVNSIIIEDQDEGNIIKDINVCDVGEEPTELISKDLEDGTSPLHIASMKNSLYILELLIFKGATLVYSHKTNSSALDVVGINSVDPKNEEDKFMKTYSLLLNNKLELPRVTKWFDDRRCEKVKRSDTALHTAVKFEYLTAIEDLLNKGGCVGVWEKGGETAIHLTVRDGLMKSLLAILKWNLRTRKLQVDARNRIGFTSLQLASFLGYADFVAVLLQGGADPSLTTLLRKDFFVGGHWKLDFGLFVYSNEDSAGEAPERETNTSDVETGTEMTKFKQDLLTMTSCCCAVMGNSLECVKILSMEGDPLKFTSENKMNMLHLAAWCNATEIIRFLLAKYKELSVLNDLVNQLCEEGTGLNGFGMAPIHFASFHSLKTAETIKLLVEEGNCDINLPAQSREYGNNTPLHFATIKGIWEDIELLYKYDEGALKRHYKKRKQDRQVLMVPHTAAVYSHPDTLRQFLFLGADLSSISEDENKTITLVETIETFIPDYVDYLEEIMDEHIDLEHYDDAHSHVVLNYQLLAPGHKLEPQMSVMNALVTNDKVEERQALLLHPLTETFLYLKWQRLKTIFNVYVSLQLVLTLLITAVGYMTYVHQPQTGSGEEPTAARLITTILRYLLGFMAVIMVMLNPYIELKKLHKFEWLLDIQTLSWLTMLISSLVMVFTDEGFRCGRGVAALAILLSWIQLLYLLARYPWSERYPLGYHFVMFLTVASKFIQIAASFSLLFIAFTLSFLVLLSDEASTSDVENPFKSPTKSFFKTLTMITDFDNEQLFKNNSTTDFIGGIGIFLGNAIFLGFFFIMCIAMVNFMTGVACDDITALKREGKARQIFEQAQTLTRLEKIMGKALVKKAKIEIQVPLTQTVWLRDSIHENKDIPRDLALSVYERVKAILKKKKNEEQKEETD